MLGDGEKNVGAATSSVGMTKTKYVTAVVDLLLAG
jgi:hypothetical protein